MNQNTELALFDPSTNPQPRCPVVLLLDTSSSMDGEPISQLQEGIEQFYQEVCADPFSRLSVETAIITYGGAVKVAMPFTPCIDIQAVRVPQLEACGMTPMGEAISLGLHEIERRRSEYQRKGIAAYKPWMVLMTDGQPNDNWNGPATRARAMADAGRLVFFGVGIGNDADIDTLRTILPTKSPPKQLQGLRFAEFFQWLSDSLHSVSTSSTSEKIHLPPTDEWSVI